MTDLSLILGCCLESDGNRISFDGMQGVRDCNDYNFVSDAKVCFFRLSCKRYPHFFGMESETLQFFNSKRVGQMTIRVFFFLRFYGM